MSSLSRWLVGLLLLTVGAVTLGQETADENLVPVQLTAEGIQAPQTVAEGLARVEFANDSEDAGNLLLAWPDGTLKFEVQLQPGESRSVVIRLEAGTYSLARSEDGQSVAEGAVELVVGDDPQGAQSGEAEQADAEGGAEQAGEETGAAAADDQANSGAEAEGAVAEVDGEALLARGQEVYQLNCASCHGSSGNGGMGPPLAGNDYLEDADFVIEQIMHGGAFMPAFGHLSDEQIAAVASRIRNSWGNDFGLVTPEEVAELR